MNNRFESFVDVVYALNKEIQRIKSEKMGSLGLRGIDTPFPDTKLVSNLSVLFADAPCIGG